MDHQAIAQLLGNYGEFIGAIAVVATLAYLAIQVRHSRDSLDANTRSIQAQITQSRADNQAAKYRNMMESQHYVSITAKRVEAESDEAWVNGLSTDEWLRMRFYCFHEMHDVRNQYYQYRQGFLDESFWSSSTRAQIERLLEILPLFVPVVNRQDSEFKAVLDDIARESGLPMINDSESRWVPHRPGVST